MGNKSADALAEIARRLIALFHPDSIILFGSHAWGHPREDSDFDLMVVVPSSDLGPVQRSIQAHRAVADLGVPVDILVRTRAEFERFQDVPAALEHQIKLRGRVIHG